LSDQIAPTKLTELLQPEQAKPPEAPESTEAEKKRRIEELKARLAADPQFKIRSGTGEAFIIGLPGGIPPKRKDGA
jgi:hypothetical protein